MNPCDLIESAANIFQNENLNTPTEKQAAFSAAMHLLIEIRRSAEHQKCPIETLYRLDQVKETLFSFLALSLPAPATFDAIISLKQLLQGEEAFGD